MTMQKYGTARVGGIWHAAPVSQFPDVGCYPSCYAVVPGDIEAVATLSVDDVTQSQQADTQNGDTRRFHGRHGGGGEADLDVVRTLRTKEDFARRVGEVCQVQLARPPSKSRSLAVTNCTMNTDSRSRAKLIMIPVGMTRKILLPDYVNGECGDVGRADATRCILPKSAIAAAAALLASLPTKSATVVDDADEHCIRVDRHNP